jgi:hypothetical protein
MHAAIDEQRASVRGVAESVAMTVVPTTWCCWDSLKQGQPAAPDELA